LGAVKKWVVRTVAIFGLLLLGFIGYASWAFWPWVFPPEHRITQGTFEDLVRIGATKEELLSNPALQIHGTDTAVQWKLTTEMSADEIALLKKDKMWGLEAGLPTCRGSGSCPGTYIIFKGNVVSEVKVTCHMCP
jgi:hypothetical protein